MTADRFTSVLVFDGDCPFCSAAATALRRVDDVGALKWDHEAARTLLEAQFGDPPFALFLVDRDRRAIWAGEAAASELCDRAGMPVLVQDVVGDNYESLADAIRFVSGVEREPDPYHGRYPLADEAADRFDELAANARATHRARASTDSGTGTSPGSSTSENTVPKRDDRTDDE